MYGFFFFFTFLGEHADELQLFAWRLVGVPLVHAFFRRSGEERSGRVEDHVLQIRAGAEDRECPPEFGLG